MTIALPDELLDALDPEQRKVAQQVGGPLVVLAGAGTGKTRAITYRLAYAVATGACDPTTVLAVTFTSRSAAEMGERLRQLGVRHAQARTFHSAALRQLSYFWPRVIGGQMPEVISHKASLIFAAARSLHVNLDREGMRDVASEIEWAKVSMISSDQYAARAQGIHRAAPADLDYQTFSKMMDAYENAKQERRVIDFDDILILMCGIMQEYEDCARTIRAQYRSFIVDEYQDVSALQKRLLDLWVGGRHDVCVVGDVAQTIYSFAGASPRYLLDFVSEHQGARVVELNRDYRSTPQIVSLANNLMERASTPGAHLSQGVRGNPTTGASGESRHSDVGKSSTRGIVHLVSQRERGAAVDFSTYPDDATEAQGIAQKVADLFAQGVPLHSIAVLYRVNSQSEAFEKAFTDAGIGFVVHGGKRFFDREEIRQAMLLLRRQAVIIRSQSGGGEDAGAEASADTDAETAPTSLADQVGELLVTVGWSQSAPEGAGAVREKWDNLNALVELAKEQPDSSLVEFVDNLEQRSIAQAAPAVEGVTLSTVHAAKGLEWDAVFLPGLSEGLLPISMAKTPQTREEERRLLYVGVTRARDHLFMSWARARGEGRGRANRKCSRFLDGIWPRESQAAAGASTSQARRQSSRELSRQFVEENTPEVTSRYEMLKEWRLETSREISKPAFTVLSDQTLRDVAVACPRTLRQLAVIRGIGAVKLDQYGAAILRLLRDEEAAQ